MDRVKNFKYIFYILLVLFLSYWIYFFFKIIYESRINNYLLSENLLFYTGHFLRRALWGTIVVKLLDIQDYQSFLFFFYAAIFFLVLFYFLFINKNQLLRIIYLVSPIGFLFIGDKRAFGRKETLFIPFVFLAVAIVKLKQTQLSKILWLIIFSLVMTCIHDTFLYLVFPLFLYIIIRESFNKKYILIYSVISIVLTLVIGSIPFSSQDIESLNTFFVSKHIEWPYLRQALSSSFSQTIQESLDHLAKWNFVLYLIVAILHGILLNYLFGKKFREHKTFFTLQFIFLIVLSVLAMDYGRWIAFAFFNSCLLLSVYSDDTSLSLTKSDLIRLVGIVVVMLCIRVPIWSQFNLNDATLYYQYISPVILNALNLPGNDF